jgi:hypothetical protein
MLKVIRIKMECHVFPTSFATFTGALKNSWSDVGWQMKVNTIFQFLEAFHAALGWTRGSPVISLVQTFGRFFFLTVLIDSEPRMQPLPAVFYLSAVYSLVELFRYSFYMFHVYEINFPVLTWLRYTVWIPLYPFGFFLEAFVAFRAIPFFEETGQYSVGFPNSWNFAFHLPTAIRLYLLLFCFPSEFHYQYGTVKSINFPPHGNSVPFLARSVARLGEFSSVNEQNQIGRFKVFLELLFSSFFFWTRFDLRKPY